MRVFFRVLRVRSSGLLRRTSLPRALMAAAELSERAKATTWWGRPWGLEETATAADGVIYLERCILVRFLPQSQSILPLSERSLSRWKAWGAAGH